MIRDRFRRLRLTSWKTLRWALAFAAVPPILWACTSHPLEKPKPQPVSQTDQYIDLNPIRDIDIVFVIDNSPSMGEEQMNLQRNFPAFIDELKKIPGGLPNVHIGVVSSDVGAGTLVSAQCKPGGDRGVFRSKPECGLTGGLNYIVAENNESTKNYTDLTAAFSCMAALGDRGCGYEHQLQAARVALLDPNSGGPAENRGFLRDNAYLALIFVTDEDDCSAPPSSDLFTNPEDVMGVANSLRCSIEGHVCGSGNAHPTATAGFMSPLRECRAAEDGKLIKINEFVNFFRGLKGNRADRVIVSAIAGWPTGDANTAMYSYAMGRSEISESPACNYMGGTAMAGLRIKAFVDSFGDNGSFETICQNDFRPAMQKIGQLLAAKLQNTCVAGPPVDTVPTTPDTLDPDCRVVNRVPAGSGWKETILPQCGKGPEPCWELTPAPAGSAGGCEHGYRVDVKRGGTMPAPGAQEVIKCLTHAKPATPTMP